MGRILVIDDDPVFTKATTAVLRSHAYEVDCAQDGDEGLAKMKEHKPDLVLLDVMMEWVLAGVSVSREMMIQVELRHIPIIMISSIRTSEYRGVFPQDEYLHIDSWLDKPCSPDKLVSEVESVLSRHQEYARLARVGDTISPAQRCAQIQPDGCCQACSVRRRLGAEDCLAESGQG